MAIGNEGTTAEAIKNTSKYDVRWALWQCCVRRSAYGAGPPDGSGLAEAAREAGAVAGRAVAAACVLRRTSASQCERGAPAAPASLRAVEDALAATSKQLAARRPHPRSLVPVPRGDRQRQRLQRLLRPFRTFQAQHWWVTTVHKSQSNSQHHHVALILFKF